MVMGPMPEDHTNIGGEPGSFNTTDENQPIEQNSPTTVRVPGWREIVLGGSGGIQVKGVYVDNA